MAAAESLNRSPTTATATTIAAAAPTPCSPRATASIPMSGETRHSSEASMCSTIPASSGRRRPSESDSGPTTSCPRARPASVPVSVSCATEEDTPSSSAMRGRAGRYMSMVSGPSATMAPSTRIVRRRDGTTAVAPVVIAGLMLTGGDVAMPTVSTVP